MADDPVQSPDQTVPVYDISGPQPVLGDIPHAQVQDAITSGKYSFPKGQEISVFSPDGTPGTIPAEQAPEAFKSGYQYATPDLLNAQAEKEHYGSTGQQVITGLEGAAQGVAGPLAPLAERALGVNPEDIRKRAEYNPTTHSLSELGGFGAGALTGTGEAALLGKAGEGAAGLLGLGAEGASVGSRLAAGATKMATEMGLYQSGDEATKAVLDAPSSVGDAAAHIGMSALLGGVAGIPLTALGIGAKAAINSQVLRDFADRMAFRGSNVNLSEKLIQEAQDAHSLYHDMGSEIGGTDGIRAQAMKSLIPEVNDHIIGQAQDLVDQIGDTAENLGKSGDKAGMVDQLQQQAEKIKTAIDPQVDPLTNQPRVQLDSANIYDTMNQVKRQLGEWGKFNKAFVPLNEVEFRNSAKGLGSSFKAALEDEGIWGKAGSLQKDLNSAWSDAIPAVKDFESKFTTSIGGEKTIDPAKFNTYLSQNGRATTETIRQQMMGNFVDAVEKFSGATDKAYEAAGVENPFKMGSTQALRESLGVPTLGTKLADLWFDKLGAKGLGDVAGGAVGGALGHATGIPEAGFGGAYLGKWALGPVFTSIIKPLMEKGASMPAFQSAIKYSAAVLKGDHELTNTAANVFASQVKALSSHLYPSSDSVDTLDKKLKKFAENPKPMLNVAGNLGNYMPDHAQAVSQTTMNAVNYLNSQRPSNPKQSPLDSDLPVSKAQLAPFHRSLEIAEQPLMAFQHIKQGTLLPQDVNTLKTVYPDYYNKMSQKLMSAMTDHISEGGNVPYKLRQSASLFLGQPLDSTMTPSSIQAIQSMYAQNQPTSQAQAQPAGKGKKGAPSKLNKIASNLQTNDQARAARTNQT